MAASSGMEYLEIDVESAMEHFSRPRPSNADVVDEDEAELVWAAIERLPSIKRHNFAIVRCDSVSYPRRPRGRAGESSTFEVVDVRKLDRRVRERVLQKAFATNDQDNYNLLAGIKARFDRPRKKRLKSARCRLQPRAPKNNNKMWNGGSRSSARAYGGSGTRAGLEVPKVEVRFQGLNVSAKVHTGRRALPTLPNYVLDAVETFLTSLRILQPNKQTLTILDNVSGIVKPGRIMLLLGPPCSGKSTLLSALAGKLDSKLKTSGNVTYNGCAIDKFCVQRTAAYISQTDNHIGELTVRETLDFAARCQGASDNWAEYLKDLVRLEKEKKTHPSPEIDAFMKVASIGSEKHNLAKDYVLKVLGLDICADTLVGSDMVRGVSGGQKKRVTTGEMIVGPRKTLFMDEISTGLDSSTTYQIVKCMRNFVHQMEATVLMSLLQPAPETFDLFDDLILLSEGHIVYQGPRKHVLGFFESLGFSLPPRKGVADFLQEVTSRKDQAQYWSDRSKPYVFLPVSKIAEAFRQSEYGKSIESSLSVPNDKTKFLPSALARTKFAISKRDLLRACFSRELLLISRHRFLYLFRTCQVAFVGIITCTMFLRTRIHPVDETNGNLYLSCLFFGLIHMMFNGLPELPITISRLPVFYKQRDNFFHPAWAFSIPSWILRIPYSMIEAVVWSCIVYYTVGFAPSVGRFSRFVLLHFSMHQMALGLFQMMASVARDLIVANTFGSFALIAIFLLGGFIVPKDAIKPWWIWAFWTSPLQYGQRAISVNEFTASRWKERSATGTDTIGNNVLHLHGLPTQEYWYWLGVGVLLAYSILFNILCTLAFAYLNPLGKAQAVIPSDSAEKKDEGVLGTNSEMGSKVELLVIAPVSNRPESSQMRTSEGSTPKRGMILSFQPVSMTFHNVNYFVDMPKEMRTKGVPETRLQLLSNVSGVFRPHVLTALVGSSGAGKTTLMDVLAGRKTGGYIEGDIRISGYVKEQSTFARISGYVEQNDIHSPQVTVEESLWFSSSLRLPKGITKEDRLAFVEEVMALVELDGLRHALVGLPGSSGLSTEQRKRLTIAVELVANPSIIFMDEPTSGLDARAAAIVMRTVRNTVDTGRTVVCTIHQPSIDIFEAFDELLLMKRGGHLIYAGLLGVNSQRMIDYFQGIPGVPPIPDGYNPATWMLEISTEACEERLGLDFATVYRNSDQFREVEDLIHQLSTPAAGTEPLKFSSEFSQDTMTQFKTCFLKQNLVYWRSPQYNAVRLFFTTISSLIFGTVFWNVGSKRETAQDLQIVMGALYASCLFLGVNNASSVQPMISIERTVFYRERASGMYSSVPYAAAQGAVEIPYIFAQTIIFGCITYFMVNYEKALGKFLLYLLFNFLTFTYFTFYGMMAVGLTPSQQLAAVLSPALYSLWNLLSGFLIPKPNIPGWWIWFYHICPTAWTLRGIITSQLGDVETRLVGAGFDGTVKQFLEENLGFESGMTGVTAAVLIGFSVLFFSVYVISIKILNFQRR